MSKFYRNDHRALLHEDSTNNIMKFKIWRVGNHLPVWRPGIHFCNVTASNKNHKASFSRDNGENIPEGIICLRMYSHMDKLQKTLIQ